MEAPSVTDRREGSGVLPVSRSRSMDWVQLLVAIMLAWSAGSKILWPDRFGALPQGLGLFPVEWILPIKFAVPFTEAFVAIGLAVRAAAIPAAFCGLSLGLTFAAVHLFVLITGQPVDCGCAGVLLQRESPAAHVVLLAYSILLTLVCIRVLFHGATGEPGK